MEVAGRSASDSELYSAPTNRTRPAAVWVSEAEPHAAHRVRTVKISRRRAAIRSTAPRIRANPRHIRAATRRSGHAQPHRRAAARRGALAERRGEPSRGAAYTLRRAAARLSPAHAPFRGVSNHQMFHPRRTASRRSRSALATAHRATIPRPGCQEPHRPRPLTHGPTLEPRPYRLVSRGTHSALSAALCALAASSLAQRM